MATKYVTSILNSENIGDSLVKINNNFTNLKTALCNLRDKVTGTVHVRTFFYYGPNSATDATANMQDNIASRPSNNIIESFVNDSDKLNLVPISQVNDIAYVIYQKTGFKQSEATRITTGTAIARVISFSTTVGWSTTSPDIYSTYSPVFVIYKLTLNGSTYTVDTGYPKFAQAETLSTADWNKPEKWLQY